jgi:1-acyl-sn-glycerol-3-phosphate acyltransferase
MTPHKLPTRINPLMWTIGRIITIPFFRLGMRLRITGLEHLPKDGAVLVVSNHLSFLDPPLIGYAASPRKIYFMAKHVIFRFPPFGWLISRLGAFPVIREKADRNAIRYAKGLLDAGECLVMFPEGTRGTAPDGSMLPGLPGAGMLAFEPVVTVIPAAVWDARRVFGPVYVRFGPPVYILDLERVPRNRRNQMSIARMMVAVEGLLDELRQISPPKSAR